MFDLKLICFLCMIILNNSSRILQSGSSVPSCSKDKTITVTGIGRMSIPNDVIRLGFTIETKDKEAQNSFSKNNKISSRVNDLC